VDIHDYELLSNMTADRYENLPIGSFYDAMQMINSDDWVQYALDKPMVSDPGTNFKYNSGASHLLSTIIHNKTGMNTEDFAKKHLFDPLNITDYHWWNDSMGITMGAFGLWLQPIDMAKIGYLYLNNGTWNGSQIVPKEWVQESTIPYTTASAMDPYGYQWWIDPEKTYYYAFGLGGQYILVHPDEKMVIALTSSEYTHAVFQPGHTIGLILESLNPETTTNEPTTPTTSSSPSSNISTTPTSSTTSSITPAVTPAFSFIPLLFCLLLLTIGLRKKKRRKVM
ncbi:MAG: serine hydrolase domain-containing protein, partial [Candidatus Hodarchaeales archaeon]